jgi:hypothetical protein
MARNGDSHPTPDDPNTGPVPHFPPGTPKPQNVIELERPGKPTEVPGEDYPPERKPFPDTLPDPGISKH